MSVFGEITGTIETIRELDNTPFDSIDIKSTIAKIKRHIRHIEKHLFTQTNEYKVLTNFINDARNYRQSDCDQLQIETNTKEMIAYKNASRVLYNLYILAKDMFELKTETSKNCVYCILTKDDFRYRKCYVFYNEEVTEEQKIWYYCVEALMYYKFHTGKYAVVVTELE